MFLKSQKVPVAEVCIGDVSKEDCIRALTPLLSEENKKKKREYATVLAFDVKILPEAQRFSDENGIKIITAKIIYHLTDQFTEHIKFIKQKAREEEGKAAIFPCIANIVSIIYAKHPIILGVEVDRGILKVGTPLCIPGKENLLLGTVEGIQKDKKPLKHATKNSGAIAVRINGDKSIMANRHFDEKDKLYSKISRNSIDCLKDHFRDDMTKEYWDLIRELKDLFEVM